MSSPIATEPKVVVPCAALAGYDFLKVLDAPTRVTEATPQNATNDEPPHCQVRGYVASQIGFEIVLPALSWNGKFIEVGCSGFCGSIERDKCADPLRRGYACIVSDMGHKGEDGLWAYNNLQAKIDWGYRGPHVVALAGKAIAERYYGRAPRRSYFMGCSTGGRQGMVEAQRFPWDFDGVIAGAPPLNFTANSMAQLWASLAARGVSGRPVLNSATVQLLHNAALAECDDDDGVLDGVVGNPKACHLDLESLACNGGAKKECMTSEQIEAARKIYMGPFAASGLIAGGGFMPGSELEWKDVYFTADGGPGFLYWYASEKFRYTAFSPDAGTDWKPTDVDFKEDYKRLGTMESLYSATNPDLRQFRNAGGKILMYHGWNDPLEPPAATTDYYEAVERVIGSRPAAQDFIRLFMVPGMGHCVDGEGAWAIDYLSYLEDWVERGKAPEKLIGGHVELPSDPSKAQQMLENLRYPLKRSEETFSRPVYPYPSRAKYSGRGDPRVAASFIAIQ